MTKKELTKKEEKSSANSRKVDWTKLSNAELVARLAENKKI